ncbi:MAG: hypothetical protein KDI79_12450, partial [Anaerolineae bacterium]|nr:hypothetical protein [Anaerolineae bacterium]
MRSPPLPHHLNRHRRRGDLVAGGIDADGLEGVAARLHLPQSFVAGGEGLAVDQQRHVADGHAVGRANLDADLLLIERD